MFGMKQYQHKIPLIILVLFSMLGSCMALWSRCPRQCSCRSSWIRGLTTVEVDCASKNLVKIPTIRDGLPRDVTRFILYKNFLQEIPADAFKGLKYLREIYMYENFISKIDEKAFYGLRRLKTLSLHHNRITRIENGTFGHLRNLQSLHLFSNFLEDITTSTFYGLRRLKTLSLHENHLRFIPKESFDSMKDLRFLSLHRNHLSSVITDVFCRSLNMMQLYLDQNKITHIEDGSFKDCGHMVKLTLGYNRLVNISRHTFDGLTRLEELFMNNNYLTSLPSGTFNALHNLKQLSLKGNQLSVFENEVFVGLTGLLQLSLSKNLISALKPEKFVGLSRLTKLFLEENKITDIYSKAFSGLTNVRTLYLYRNHLSNIPAQAFIGLDSLTELNLGVNRISSVENDAFMGLSNLQSLALNSNRLKIIPAKAFSGLNSLEKLTLYFNSISYVAEGAFSSLGKLKTLSWSPAIALIRFNPRLQAVPSNSLFCDCNALWLQSWLNNRTLLNPSRFICTAPETVKGKDLLQLKRTDFHCEMKQAAISPNQAVASVGSSVSFNCAIEPGAEFTWMHNGINIDPNNKKYYLMTAGLLTVNYLSAKDEGQFICLAKNKAGLTAVSASLSIGVAPTILKHLEEIVIVATPMRSLVLPCHASGFPKPSISWIKDGIEVQGDDNKLFSNDGSLIILSMKGRDQGIYTCIAKNVVGQQSVTAKVYLAQGSMCLPSCRRDAGYCVVKHECECLPEFEGPSCEFRKASVDSIETLRNNSVNGKPALVAHPTAWAYETYNMDLDSGSAESPEENDTDDEDVAAAVKKEIKSVKTKSEESVTTTKPRTDKNHKSYKPSKSFPPSLAPSTSTRKDSKLKMTRTDASTTTTTGNLAAVKAPLLSSRSLRSPKLRNLKIKFHVIDDIVLEENLKDFDGVK